jgi:hypothetical protein
VTKYEHDYASYCVHNVLLTVSASHMCNTHVVCFPARVSFSTIRNLRRTLKTPASEVQFTLRRSGDNGHSRTSLELPICARSDRLLSTLACMRDLDKTFRLPRGSNLTCSPYAICLRASHVHSSHAYRDNGLR